MRLFIDCRNDDDIRLHRLILATLNHAWAYHPNITWDETNKYLRRAAHAGRSVDLHQPKDTTSNEQIIFPIAPVNLDELKEI